MTSRMFFVSIALCLPALAGCSSDHSAHRLVHHFRGDASLPLSGDLGPAGQAFRAGFEDGLASGGDSLVSWRWRWHDNEGSSELLQAWIDSLSDSTRKAPDLLLGGFGTAVADLDLASVRTPMLWFGDGSPMTNPVMWPLWLDRTRLHEALASWIATQDTPSVALVLADGAWTPPFFDADFPGLEILPHDPLVRRWDREMGQILADKPRTILCWNRPEDATSFVTRLLIAPFLAGRTLLLPDGVPAPAGARVFRVRPLWQPSLPVDSLQIAFLRSWGRVVGRAVASSTRAKIRDSHASWRGAFGLAECDSLRIDPSSGGWMPRLEIVADSVAAPALERSVGQ